MSPLEQNIPPPPSDFWDRVVREVARCLVTRTTDGVVSVTDMKKRPLGPYVAFDKQAGGYGL